MIANSLTAAGLIKSADTPFARAMANLMKGSVDLLSDAPQQLPALVGYPLADTVASGEFKPVSHVDGAAAAAGLI